MSAGGAPVAPAARPAVGRLAIVGVGLIGGSLALALRRAGEVGTVLGVGRGRRNLEVALERGIVDEALAVDQDWAGAAGAADVVVLATPVAQMPGLLAALAPRLAAGTVVTDAGSTKADVIAAARAGLGRRFASFVPAHPIAGTEFSGAGAAFAELYDGRNVVVCPEPETDRGAVERVEAMWRLAGAHVRRLAAADHDRVFAAVSHLPHLLAFALVADIAGRPDADLFFDFAASGFRDFTRIASSHPEMWRDICVANREALRGELARYRGRLGALEQALVSADAARLEDVFGAARDARNRWIARRQAAAGHATRAGGNDPDEASSE
jgi:prephenate dehydrogenase